MVSAAVRRLIPLSVLGCTLLLFASCGWGDSAYDEDEGHHPSAETLQELREHSGHETIYWLGERFAGKEISGAELTDEGATVNYGKTHCDPGSGCQSFPITISTAAGWPSPYLPPASKPHTCFDHIRRAVLISDCRLSRHPWAQWGDLFVGPKPGERYASTERITLQISGPIGDRKHLSIEKLARAIYPIEARSSVPRQLPPPEPAPCSKLKFLVRWWVVANRSEIGPNRDCGLRELLGLF
jgi:hypothetical protein